MVIKHLLKNLISEFYFGCLQCLSYFSSQITVHKTKEAKKVPMQLDGEPWEQGSCVITVTHKGQVLMLKKKDDS